MGQHNHQTIITNTLAQLKHAEDVAIHTLTSMYHSTISAIKPLLDRLFAQLGQAQQNGFVSLSWLYEQSRLASLKQAITTHINQFAAVVHSTVAHLQTQGVTMGMQSGQQHLRATVPPGINWTFNHPSPEAIARITNATRAGTPLGDLFAGYGEEAARNVSKALISGITNGDNPRTIATQVMQALDIPRWRALATCRTSMLNAYRATNLSIFQANSDVVESWIWVAALGSNPPPCIACIAMHGTVHPLTEPMASHVQCRCVQAPKTRSWSDIVGAAGIDASGIDETSFTTQSGSAWFDEQSEATQKAVLGPGAYAAFSAGKFDLSDMVGVSHDVQWGPSVYVRPLKDLVK